MPRSNSDSLDNFSPEEFPFLSSHHLSSIDSIETIDTELSLTPPRSYSLSLTPPRSYSLSPTTREGININVETPTPTTHNNNQQFFGESFSPHSVESLDFDYYNGSHTDTILMPLDENNFYQNIYSSQRQRTRRNAITSISPSVLANLNFN